MYMYICIEGSRFEAIFWGRAGSSRCRFRPLTKSVGSRVLPRNRRRRQKRDAFIHSGAFNVQPYAFNVHPYALNVTSGAFNVHIGFGPYPSPRATLACTQVGLHTDIKPLFKPLFHWKIQFSPQCFADGFAAGKDSRADGRGSLT
eukprot:5763870-Pyramimonas_sp.AAC.1